MSNDTFLSRFKIALFRSGQKQLDIAVMSGLSEQYLSKIIHGDPDYDNRYVPLIAAALGVNPVWLGTGKGSMALDDTSSSALPAQINEKKSGESREIGIEPLGMDKIILPTLSPRVSLSATASGNNENNPPPTIIPAHWRALIITNDSGLPLVFPGQKVLVDPSVKDLRRDHIVAINLYGDFLLKKLINIEHGELLITGLGSNSDTISIPLGNLSRPPLVVVGTLWSSKAVGIIK